ncbi:hypothetical protein BaRGS_00028964, partial [Batillaria attramentaria]
GRGPQGLMEQTTSDIKGSGNAGARARSGIMEPFHFWAASCARRELTVVSLLHPPP